MSEAVSPDNLRRWIRTHMGLLTSKEINVNGKPKTVRIKGTLSHEFCVKVCNDVRYHGLSADKAAEVYNAIH